MFWFLFGIVIFLGYWLLCFFYSYWDRQCVPNLKPHIPYGNLKETVKKQKPFGLQIYDLYNSTKLPYIGIYLLFRPALLIRDAELVKTILTKDFNCFYDRGLHCNGKIDPLSENIFSMRGQKWKSLRSKLMQTFTSGKLKSMFPTILNVATKLEESLVPNAINNNVVDIKELISNYTVDVIASVIFGVEVDSINNPKHEFREMGRRETTKTEFIPALRAMGMFLCPKILDFFRVGSVSNMTRKYLMNLVRKTINNREEENITRKDLMQLLVQIRNNGKTNQDGIWNVETVEEKLKTMTIEECAAQAYVFYIAGSEATSFTVSSTLHEITQNPLIMDKLVDEIDKVLAQHKGEITYECLQEMTYLDLCVKETLRMYPPLSILNRECTENYRVPGTEFTIKKGTPIIISVLGLHKDANNFPNPDIYNPERFLPENIDFNESAYIPFGDGPRNCIAYRMGRIMIKVALVSLLRKYKFEATSNEPIKYFGVGIVLVPINGINLKVSLRKIENE